MYAYVTYYTTLTLQAVYNLYPFKLVCLIYPSLVKVVNVHGLPVLCETTHR